MARVMLATKTILTEADQVPILIFDEVDANIGGLAALKVAQELRAISARHQVLCVTHLPQIAAAADLHLRVEKHTDHGRTTTDMTPLTDRECVQEIARMLGAGDESGTAVAHARQPIREQVMRVKFPKDSPE